MDHQYTEGQLEDDGSEDVFALFVLEDVPIAMVNEVLQGNHDQASTNYMWLADSYDNLVDIDQSNKDGNKRPQVDEQWHSPFIGKSVQDAAEFIKNCPKPPKALNKVHFAVLDRAMYESHGWLPVYRYEDGELQTMPCDADMVSTFFIAYDRDTWEESLRIWKEDGIPALQ
ncbi:uncharacterized protein LTR77_008085 [Saxophila tyrrhenica]|uniref:Uncharacterized protein n=1 Tax=Saxophila tyrrhenica TaxID=1690608 RepID=A0AAV9P1T0_9PEZI|nr:hypothetical protein LTR77_008085 [Saxophila tyrrhenica]